MNLYEYGSTYETPDIDPYSLSGSGVPKEARFFQAANNAYEKKAPKFLNPINNNYRLIVDTPTIDAYLNTIDNSILIGIRGTNPTDTKDLRADAKLLANQLHSSDRYKQDKEIMEHIVTMFPPESHEYYASGHSLGTAILNEFKRDFPFIRYGIGYNGAYQPIDFMKQSSDIKRLYMDKDFLYKLGGRMFRNKVVLPTPPDKSTFSFLKPSGLHAHMISNFEPIYEGQGSLLSRFKKTEVEPLTENENIQNMREQLKIIEPRVQTLKNQLEEVNEQIIDAHRVIRRIIDTNNGYMHRHRLRDNIITVNRLEPIQEEIEERYETLLGEKQALLDRLNNLNPEDYLETVHTPEPSVTRGGGAQGKLPQSYHVF